MGGYDIIGDVHGCGTELTALLDVLGYRKDPATEAYGHPQRQAIFVGDLVDRGQNQLGVLQLVKRMVDTGNAQITMGNHEFNAIAYDTPVPNRPGEFLRPRSQKNDDQHEAFLKQLTPDDRDLYLEWFLTLPLWLDLGGVRVVHACWHEPSMRAVEAALGSNRFSSREQFVAATTKGDPLYEAVEVLLKGPEIDLATHGAPPYYDKGGHARTNARVAWWRDGASTLRNLAITNGNFTTVDGEQYPELPNVEVPGGDAFAYRDDVPVIYGHYWRSGRPKPDVDYTNRTACVDFSAIDTGKLGAYRWDGESEIQVEHYVNV